jgi:hypothetical protein
LANIHQTENMELFTGKKGKKAQTLFLAQSAQAHCTCFLHLPVFVVPMRP